MNTKTTNENLMKNSNQSQQEQTQFINKSKFKKMETNKEVRLAKRVVELYPSFHELMKNSTIPNILNPMERGMFRNNSEWEGITIAVDKMCRNTQDLGWYDGYSISKKGNGTGTVLDHMGRTYEVDGMVFWALTKIMFCSWLGVDVGREAYESMLDLKEVGNNFKILD